MLGLDWACVSSPHHRPLFFVLDCFWLEQVGLSDLVRARLQGTLSSLDLDSARYLSSRSGRNQESGDTEQARKQASGREQIEHMLDCIAHKTASFHAVIWMTCTMDYQEAPIKDEATLASHHPQE